jgi:hypothetical protein
MTAGQQQRQPQFRRLAISDLLVLTFAVGASLAFVAPTIHEIRKMPEDMLRGSHLAAVSVPVVDHLAIGLKLFGLAILTRERLRSRLAGLSPGHWYFVIAGPIAIYLLLSELLPLSIRARWPVMDEMIPAVLYLGAGIVGSRAVLMTQFWRWRVCLGLLTASLLIVSVIAAYRAAEICGYAGHQYRHHLIAAWGSAAIASCLAAAIAVAADLAYATRRDWLHYFAVVALFLNSTAIWLAWRPIITRFWLDFYSHFLG